MANENQQEGRYTQQGSVHRYETMPAPTEEKVDAPRPDGIQIRTASRHRATATGVEDISGSGSHQSGGSSPAGDPLDSAMDLQGSPVGREALTPKSVLKLGGNLGDATVQSLVDLGFLRKDSAGRYEWTPADLNREAEAQRQTEEGDAAPLPVPLDEEHEAAFSHAVERLGSPTLTSLAISAIKGDDATAMKGAEQMAVKLGYENTEDFRADYTTLKETLIAKGESFLTGLGVKDTDTFRTWARYDSETRARFDDAVLSFVNGNGRPLERLAKRYLAQQ